MIITLGVAKKVVLKIGHCCIIIIIIITIIIITIIIIIILYFIYSFLGTTVLETNINKKKTVMKASHW